MLIEKSGASSGDNGGDGRDKARCVPSENAAARENVGERNIK